MKDEIPEVVEAVDYLGTDIYKSINPNLIPIRKTVIDKRGRTFTRTYYVKPKDYVSFENTKDAVEFLAHTSDALEYFAPIVQRLQKYNEELAKKAYAAMEASGKKSYTLADRVVSMAQWSSGRSQENAADILAMIRAKTAGNKKIGWSDVEKIFRDVSYTITHSGLSMSVKGQEKPIAKIGVSETYVPTDWSSKVGGYVKKLTDRISRVSQFVASKFNLQQRSEVAVELPKPAGKVEPVQKKLIVKKINKKKEEPKKQSTNDKKKKQKGDK